jgi:MtN3 and saliva related transmembrane protein
MRESTELIGYVAAILTTASFVPQVLQVVRTRNTRAISRTMYVAFCLGIAMWLLYGIALASPPIIAANAVTLVLASVVLGYKLRFG